MALQKFLFNPGINKEGTNYTAEGGWFDGNKGSQKKQVGGKNPLLNPMTVQAENFLVGLIYRAPNFLDQELEQNYTYKREMTLMT